MSALGPRVHRRSRPTPIVEDQSAGGVVVRAPKILLITPRPERWQLPKGHPEPGEDLAAAAVREVAEETGVEADVVAQLPAVEYDYWERRGDRPRRIHKRVDFFLMQYRTGDTWSADPSEVGAAAWMTWDEALDRLSFDNERRVVLAARSVVEGGDAADLEVVESNKETSS